MQSRVDSPHPSTPALALKQCFSGRGCTAMLLEDLKSNDRDLQVQSIAHGVVLLEQLNPEYGAEHRRLEGREVERVISRKSEKTRSAVL